VTRPTSPLPSSVTAPRQRA